MGGYRQCCHHASGVYCEEPVVPNFAYRTAIGLWILLLITPCGSANVREIPRFYAFLVTHSDRLGQALSTQENGYVESFNGKLRDALLNGEIFDTLLEAQVIMENRRREYDRFRLHGSLRYRPPAPEAREPAGLTRHI